MGFAGCRSCWEEQRLGTAFFWTGRRKGKRGSLQVKQESLEDRKAALLANKQAELEMVVDRHDTFVRSVTFSSPARF